MSTRAFQTSRWEQTDAQIFWGEIAPTQHVVQIFENENSLIDLLENYVVGGIRSGDAVILIATESHIQTISGKLRDAGFDPFQLKLKDQFLPLDAHQMLDHFMVDGKPDPLLFRHAVSDLMARAGRYNRQVRAYGEMVAILWQQGKKEQALQLEELWNEFCVNNEFALFCAYPQDVFNHDNDQSIRKVCSAHSHVITAAGVNSNDVLYKRV